MNIWASFIACLKKIQEWISRAVRHVQAFEKRGVMIHHVVIFTVLEDYRCFRSAAIAPSYLDPGALLQSQVFHIETIRQHTEGGIMKAVIWPQAGAQDPLHTRRAPEMLIEVVPEQSSTINSKLCPPESMTSQLLWDEKSRSSHTSGSTIPGLIRESIHRKPRIRSHQQHLFALVGPRMAGDNFTF
jgi:hypothetical protein